MRKKRRKKVYIRCNECGRILKGRAIEKVSQVAFLPVREWVIERFPSHKRWNNVPREKRLQHLVTHKTHKPVKTRCLGYYRGEIVGDRE